MFYFSFSECNAGYYKDGGDGGCILCSGNKIKSSPGDDTDCNTDTTCDGNITVPNIGHTTCGKKMIESEGY